MGEAVSPIAPTTTLRFREMSSQSKIEFAYSNGEEGGLYAILESLGGGVALFDFNGDDLPDLFVPGGGDFGPNEQIRGRPPALFANLGGWRFADVTDRSGTGVAPHYSHGAAAADFDNDGFTDVLITGYGGLVLLRNQGDGTFADVALAANLDDRLWSSSAGWGDFDGDGNLDLYVAHYVNWSFANHPVCPGPKPGTRDVCPPRSFQPLPDSLYMNNGDGTFRDASRSAGLVVDGPNTGKGLGVLVADVDLDGRLDIYVANDTVPNFLYRNRGGATFEDVSLMSGTSVNDTGSPDGSMGVDLGDFDLDGLPDLWVANFERESFALYRNQGNCMFQHVSHSTGITALGGLYVGWGTLFCDFDSDGDEDIFASNGHVVRFPVDSSLMQKPLLLENRGAGRFTNVASQGGAYFQEGHMGRGAALGDIDGDGKIDLAVSRTNQPVVLLRNESSSENHWIGIRLVGTRASRQPIGAVVRLNGPGGRPQIRQVKGGSSYASTSDIRLHFGVGTQSREFEAEIRWPSGRNQVVTNLKPGHSFTVIEP
jgi:enediyne biosynthesis protein E4